MLEELIKRTTELIEILRPQRELVKFRWTNTGVATGVVPDNNIAVDVSKCKIIAVQSSTYPDGNTSTDLDINILASLNGIEFDTIPFTYHNLGNDERKTMLVDVEYLTSIKLTADNNAGATTGYAVVTINKVM